MCRSEDNYESGLSTMCILEIKFRAASLVVSSSAQRDLPALK